MNKAFTLTEILVMLSIIVILSGGFILNYHTENENRNLIDASYLILQGIRMTQNLALAQSKMPTECGGGDSLKSFGVYFSTTSQNIFDFFVDKNNDGSYNFFVDTCDCIDKEEETYECFQRQTLPKKIKINEIKIIGADETTTTCTTGWINFVLSDSSVEIHSSGCSPSPTDSKQLKIEICAESNCENMKKSIIVNNKGMVEIQ